MSKKIKLTRGQEAIVDDQDFEWLNQWMWYCNGDGYAARKPWSTKKLIFMHRLICNTPTGMITDHVDGNPLNNTRSNLRICTKSQNGMNRTKPSNNVSGYKGVCWNKKFNKWEVHAGARKNRRSGGYFENILDAALAYDRIAKEIWGEFAHPNIEVK
jgi:hypothetical protein